MYRSFCLLLLILCFSSSSLTAQTATIRPIQLGLHLGIGNVLGDLTQSDLPNFSSTGFSTGVFAKMPIDPKIGIRAGFTHSKLKGEDYDDASDRGFSFNNNLYEIMLVGEYEPFGRDRFFTDATGEVQMDKLISPYVFLGFGLGLVNLDPDFNESTEPGVVQDRNQGSNATTLVVPFGVGVRFDLSDLLTLGVETGMRFTTTDYIDGISEAANPDGNDAYVISNVQLLFRLQNP